MMHVRLFTGALATLPLRVAAQTPTLIPTQGTIPECDFASGQLSADCIPAYIAYLIRTIFGLTGVIFLIMIIISGYQFALRGVTQDDSGAKQRLFNAIVGFIVCALSFFIIDFIISTLAGL